MTDSQAAALLDLARQLTRDLQPGRRRTRLLELTSSLDRDFGFDSLARAELFLRIERSLGVSLPEELLASAETLQDLLLALRSAHTARMTPMPARVERAPPEVLLEVPETAQDLLEVLRWHANAHGDRVHLYLDAGGPLQPLTYRELMQSAGVLARGLRARGLEARGAAALMLPTGLDYLRTFFGVLMAGGTPVPLYPPGRISQIEDHLRHEAGILVNCRAALLVTTPAVQRMRWVLGSLVPGLQLTTPDELRALGAATQPGASVEPHVPVRSNDVALVQYTSGSTGNPKGVVLTHENLLANVRAMGQATEISPADVVVSWLPLYHDMGLIGAWLGSLYHGCPLVLMSPLRFLARPARWLWAMHAHGGTISSAPNFAYELCAAKVSDEDIRGLDLSSWRMALNGAEPVSPATVRHFCDRFAGFGFRPEAMAPVYGLAECSVGLAFPPPGRGPRIDRVDLAELTSTGSAVPARSDDRQGIDIVGCGQPLPRHEVRIVDEQSRELPARRQGRLQFRGPSATRGYQANPTETARLFDGDWLESGDLAYIAEGEVYITGRSKDIIVRAGRHIHPHEIEDAVGRIERVRRGCVAVFGQPDPRAGTERVVIAVETREVNAAVHAELREHVIAVATQLLGEPPDEIVLLPPHSVPKTTSGKIRRAACRAAYEQGRLGRGSRSLPVQLARLAWSGALERARRARQATLAVLFAGYVWLLLFLLGPLVWLLVALLPRHKQRWAVAHRAARCLFALAAVRVHLDGDSGPLPKPAVLVANHSSYLDGFVLMAALAEPVRFVAKAELTRSTLTRLPLYKLGAHFVERWDVAQSLTAARRATEIATAGGAPLLFFPEGTFTRAPGLARFHLGAFLTAAESGVTVVPAVIRGTRSMLRDGSWLPRRGTARVLIGPALRPTGRDFAAAVQLRDAARAWMLQHCEEPDLDSGV